MNRHWWIAFATAVTLWGCQERIDPVGPRDLAESAGKGSGKGVSTPSATMTVLIPSGDARYVDVFGWNDARQAVGRVYVNSNEPVYGFLWSGGTTRSLGSNSWATDVDADGRVVGHTWLADGGLDRATVWEPSSGSMELLPTSAGKWSHAYAISDNGEWVSGDVNRQPVVWRRGAGGGWSRADLDSELALVRDVNDTGLVVGMLGEWGGGGAVAWTSSGSRHLLAPLGASGWTGADGVNNRGDIVGSARDVDGITKAVVWRRTGSGWTAPEVISDPKWKSSLRSEARDINEAGKIVLNRITMGGTYAFVWDPDTRTRISLGGGTAVAINEFDQIVGNYRPDEVVMWTLP